MEGSTTLPVAPSLPQGLQSLNDDSQKEISRSQETQQPSLVPQGLPIAADPYARLYHSVNKGDIEFQGFSSDRTFILGIKRQLGFWEDDMEQKRLLNTSVLSLFDTSSGIPPVDASLPSRTMATRLVEAALNGQIIFSIVHRPSFNSLFNLVYSLEESDYSTHERRFLPLLYAVMAFGSLFADLAELDEEKDMLSLGYQYYEKSKRLQDIADCKDLISLQAIFFKISFLLVTSRVFTCYTYTSTALSIALRMGLHRSFPNPPDLISCEIGKRLFWALWTLGNDVAVTCGLPMIFDRSSIDQDLPIEVSDIYIEQQHIGQQPQNDVCYIVASNMYRRLHIIIQDVTSQIYADKRFNKVQTGGGMSYSISMETLKNIENNLTAWVLDLPAHFTLGKHFEDSQATMYDPLATCNGRY
ncbi:hypothetical protein N7478_005087 [Penicillium angulare]|uniref:uncharacterized protein n=1 Tax=Penicillium angulare TaxID=116970 RepID=UPI0025412433|nr:uncharacterized protein N7478_005087 [Penicillium angulare]KAJ5279715.1 hypothetical protein N7478_005087 [Penicillium angulare]